MPGLSKSGHSFRRIPDKENQHAAPLAVVDMKRAPAHRERATSKASGVPVHAPPMRGRRGSWKSLVLVVVSLFAILLAATYFGDGPLRRTLETNMNRKLKGYTASIGHAHLSLLGLSVTLRNVSVAQQRTLIRP
jgi:hypothetical protein